MPGFSLSALFNHFAAHGVSSRDLSFFFSLIGAPWCLQVFAAPLIDRFDQFAVGRRRAWILFAAAGANLSLLFLLRIQSPLTQITEIAWIFFAHSVFSALLNVACDALIVDQTPEAESAATGAFARSGLSVASAVSGALFANVLPVIGFQMCAAALIALHLAVTISICFTRESSNDKLICWRRKKHSSETKKNWALVFSEALQSSRRPAVLKWLFFTFSLSFLYVLLRMVFTTQILRTGVLTDAALSQGQSVVSLLIGTIGALSATVIVNRIGSLRAILSSLAVSSAICLALAVLDLTTLKLLVWPLIATLAWAPTILFIAYLPSLMSLSKGAIAATQFGAFMAVMNFGETMGSAFFGQMSATSSALYTGLAAAFIGTALGYVWAFGAKRSVETMTSASAPRNRPDSMANTPDLEIVANTKSEIVEPASPPKFISVMHNVNDVAATAPRLTSITPGTIETKMNPGATVNTVI